MTDAERKATWHYRAMIYAAIGTLHFYREDMAPYEFAGGVSGWIAENLAVVDQVRREVSDRFEYELNDDQIRMAIKAYFVPATRLGRDVK